MVGLLAAALPFTAVVALDPSGWFPFSVAKWSAVVVVGLASCAAALVAAATVPMNRPLGRVERVGAVMFLSLVAVTALSAVWGLDGIYTWIGTPVRHLGALTWLFFGAMFLVGHRVADADRSIETVVHGVVLAGLALGLYCVVEATFGAPVEFVSNSSRLGGPFGSAAYLGAACCLLGPVALSMAVDRGTSTAWRLTAGSAAALLTVAFVGSGSRAAFVGVLVAVLIGV
ncbi:MAG: hypothetical protein WBP59_08725, partial [Ilumatobacteraceae bacterium]